MSIGRPFRLRVPPRERHEPKIYDVDPEAVARLKRILAEREATEERTKEARKARLKARITARKAERTVEVSQHTSTAPAETSVPEKETSTEEAPMEKVTPTQIRKKPGSLKRRMTPERAAKWAAMRADGKSYGWITRHDDLHPSGPSIKSYLKKYGFNYDGSRLDHGTRVELESEKKPAAAVKVEKALAPGPSTDIVQDEDEEPPMPAWLAAGRPGLAVKDVAVDGQLAVVQQLMATLQAANIQVSGRITLALNVEIDI